MLIVVRDGWGVRPDQGPGNAVALARTPRHDELWKRFPTALVNASEHWVGLPDGQMGNSEVGHLNMGAGRLVFQDLGRIYDAIRTGAFFENAALRGAVARAEERDRALHLFGLVSDGGVHSHIDHVRELLRMAKQAGLKQVFVHVLTDGRDTDPNSGAGFVRTLQGWMQELGVGRIASVAGRYYTMDRDKRWDRVQKGWEAMVLGRGLAAKDPVAAIEASYAANVTDEFIVPRVVVDEQERPIGPMQRGDQAIAFNFRGDRMRQICAALTDPGFDGFERGSKVVFEVVGLTQYDDKLPVRGVAFPPQRVNNHLVEWVSSLGLATFKCAETEKYAHVTFFWNGGEEAPCKGEERHLVPSPKVATYDLQPEMSAREVATAVEQRIATRDDALLVVNYANADMVGHTGKLEAGIAAVETVDECVGRIVEAMLKKGGAAIVTADHGNCEMMIDPATGRAHTAHTTFPVHAIVCDQAAIGRRVRDKGRLADIAPTALELMGIKPPPEMTASSLLLPS